MSKREYGDTGTSGDDAGNSQIGRGRTAAAPSRVVAKLCIVTPLAGRRVFLVNSADSSRNQSRDKSRNLYYTTTCCIRRLQTQLNSLQSLLESLARGRDRVGT